MPPPADNQIEDAQTFWARSNARLGVDPDIGNAGKKGSRSPMDYPCAVCGVFVPVERWPKHRHEVRCDACRRAVGDLLTEDERQDLVKSRRANRSTQIDGLPAMTDEDLEALAEMKQVAGLGNGRTANLKKPELAPSNKKSRRSAELPDDDEDEEGEGDVDADTEPSEDGAADPRGVAAMNSAERRRRRRRRPTGKAED